MENDGNDATTVLLNDDYWTSTEHSEKYVWIYTFSNGHLFYNLKDLDWLCSRGSGIFDDYPDNKGKTGSLS